MASSKARARRLLERYRLVKGVYVLGSFESGVTVYSQQVRALNLAWAMTQVLGRAELSNIAVVGGGFAGVTFAAAMAQRGVPKITVFEKRPVLLPLQQGSDTRWLHPHIYDWPGTDSELPSAGLPVINWNAGRASDVVAQVSREWTQVCDSCKDAAGARVLREILGAKYLQIARNREVTWVTNRTEKEECGSSDSFSAIILALGFGEESGAVGKLSYWRNESLGQPELSAGVRTFLISGFGDGALVDLFRVRLVQFRQDRILSDLFLEKSPLLGALERTYRASMSRFHEPIDAELTHVFRRHQPEYIKLLGGIKDRLRRDTAAILQIKDRSLSSIYSHSSSFQNKLLAYLLFAVGGFTPSHFSIGRIMREYKIPKENVILRHGTKPEQNIKDVLSPTLHSFVDKHAKAFTRSGENNRRAILWPGGYWHQRDPRFGGPPGNAEKARWRKEYLPPVTELIAGEFCSTVATVLEQVVRRSSFRVTLHRTIEIAGVPVLQQACEYFGPLSDSGDKGRTFRVDQGIIGLAYERGQVCRSVSRRGSQVLAEDARRLGVGRDAQLMRREVKSLLAVPTLAKQGVCMVLFADSAERGVFSDAVVGRILELCGGFASFLGRAKTSGVKNFPFRGVGYKPQALRRVRLRAIESLATSQFQPPRMDGIFYLNFEMVNQ